MPYPLRFHVLLLPNVGWAELKARVLRLEELGIEVAALADHVVDWTNPTAAWFEAWTALAGAGGGDEHDPAFDRGHPDPAAQPGDAGPPGLHARSDLRTAGSSSVWARGSRIDPSSAMIGVPNWEPRERVERFA